MADSPAGGNERYLVYGVTVATNFPFRTPLIRNDRAAELTFERIWAPPADTNWQEASPIFESRYVLEDGEPQVRLFQAGNLNVFRQAGVADYYVWPNRIVCHQLDNRASDVVETYFLSLLAGFWLESTGTLALHSSAVSVNERAAAFLATNTGGKTSLAVSLMQAGHPLLTDDFLAVSVDEGGAVGHPAFPQMRMWPDLADHFLGHHEDLPVVLPSTAKRLVSLETTGLGPFCTASRSLSRLYLPERRDDADTEIRIEDVPAQEALIELVRESFLSTVLEKAGLHRVRFARLATLARQVPMARLIYPSGLERLPEVRNAILADLEVAG